MAPWSPNVPPGRPGSQVQEGRTEGGSGEPRVRGSQSFKGETHFLPGWPLPVPGPDRAGTVGALMEGGRPRAPRAQEQRLWGFSGRTVTLGGSLGAQAVRCRFGSTSHASKRWASGYRNQEAKPLLGCVVSWLGQEGLQEAPDMPHPSCRGHGILSVRSSGSLDLETADTRAQIIPLWGHSVHGELFASPRPPLTR